MKHLRMLALAAVAAGALMAFIGAGTASAAVICSTTVDPCPVLQKWPGNTPFDFSIPAGQSAHFENTAGEEINNCPISTIRGKLTVAGGEGITATGPVEELTWGASCKFTTTTVTAAALEIKKIAGTSNGTVLTDEYKPGGVLKEKRFEITINTAVFGSCIYAVEPGKTLGDLTEGNPAILHVNVVVEKSGGGGGCPESARLTATYTVTAPSGTTASISDH